ncbi:MAG: pyridoxamine 5-phosphate oxidase [Chloroflexi bacterium]|nr:MAG: pyridoxamine 5-phosphate oxidase [Chloroflexota bacterium]
MDRRAVLRVLATPLAQKLLHSEFVSRLAYVGPDGYPRVVPVGYLWKDERFVVCTASNAPKVNALQSNPRVALTIDTQTQPPHILLVRGIAAVEVVDGVPDEYLEASRRYIPEQQWSDFETQVRGLYDRMARISITAEWAKLIDFETTLPIAVEELVGRRRDR